MYCVISWKLPSGFSELGRSLQQLQIVILVAQQNKEGKNSRFQKDRRNKLYCKYFSNFGVFFYFLIRLILLSNLTCPAYIVIKQIHTYLEN